MVILFVVVSLISVKNSSAIREQIVDVDGSIIENYYDDSDDNEFDQGSSSPASLSIRVSNNHKEKVLVNWVGREEEEVTILEIPSGNSLMMNTHVGHRFFARDASSSQLIQEFVVKNTDKVIEILVPSRKKQHPLVRMMHGAKSTSVGAKFKSLSSRPLDIHWDDGKGGSVPQGVLRPGAETTTNTYHGHQFFFTEAGVSNPNDKKNEVFRAHITMEQSSYLIKDKPEFTIKSDVINLALREAAFQAEYLNRTGIQWRHYFGPNGPRDPPKLFMWPADKVGQVHKVVARHGYWECHGPADDCQSQAPLDLELEVLSTHPKVFIIDNFFSEYEADAVIEWAKPRVAESTVGQNDSGGVRKSDTRTSKNTWMNRRANDIASTLYLRAAELLRIDERLLEATENAEDIQVVHYNVGDKYSPHHDWGVSGYADSRFLTLLLYLSSQSDENAGGETAFPKGNNGHGFKVLPKKRTAVLFYSLLEDGNGDDLSLHEAMPVLKGEKVANS